MKCESCKKKSAAPARHKCWSCIKRETALKDPVKYCYQVLKNNAKRRGKEFTLTLSFFRRFCYKTDYIQNKGKTSSSYSIDRINNVKGYTPRNIRILSLADNSRKHTKKLVFDWEHKTAIVVSSQAENEARNIF